ncbi:hypothetical protein NP856_18085 [Pseudomonas sp. 17391]|uniref:hypothetical protein n=1 Tax=Pseudomonas sp. 17391 TaxID=2967217 RepID=UPI002363AF10|nr:hypothetical protein [Pseudomonas sp. 17391]MDD2131062.1 hypothetical protein [Pseudomonas sp. 17391]
MSTLLIICTIAAIATLVAAGIRFSFFSRHHQAYNNVVIASCALLTLIWGAYSFDALQQKSRAEAELAEIQRRIRDTESTFLAVNVKFEKSSDGFYLTPSATIKNSSKENIYFRLCHDSLAISKVNYDFDAGAGSAKTIYPKYYEQLAIGPNGENYPLYDIRVPVDSERTLNFFAAVKEPGVYYITFSAISTSEPGADKNLHDCSFVSNKGIKSDKKKNGKEGIWFTSSYLIIPADNKPSKNETKAKPSPSSHPATESKPRKFKSRTSPAAEAVDSSCPPQIPAHPQKTTS